MLKFLPLPVTWLLFWLGGWITARASIKTRRWIFAIASLALLLAIAGPQTTAFYATLGGLAVLMASMAGRLQNDLARRAILILAITAFTGVIVVYLGFRVYIQKYFLYLPSLSYLGFRAIAHLVTAYRRRSAEVSTGVMQMFFFPMLFTGPISRTENFDESHWNYDDVLIRLIRGLGMLIASKLCNPYVLSGFAQITDQSVGTYWLGALANSFEFYLSFAGYTHLVIGLGLLAGFKLPENFNNPYFATSISDFWRRWHISLSFWIRDYLYIPLGGNRKGVLRKCLNLLVAMSLCGIWHGLTVNYLLWGVFHGVMLSAESIMAHFGFAPLKKLPANIYRPLKTLLIFTLVTFGWLLFKYPIPQFIIYMKGMFGWNLVAM